MTTETAPKFEKLTAKRNLPGLIALLAIVLIFGSPVVEFTSDTVVYDGVITQTCWDRHGFNFLSRWSCRSALRQVGVVGMGLGCAFDKSKSDLCQNLEKINRENPR